MEPLLTALVVLTLLGLGLIAGVFFAFSSFVMKALERRPAAEGMAAMQSINVVVLNWHFLGVFFGTAVLSAALIVLALVQRDTARAAPLVTGAVLYLVGTFLVTIAANVPLNEALARQSPAAPDAGEQWRQYARRWTAWNHVRTGAALLAVLALALGLVGAG